MFVRYLCLFCVLRPINIQGHFEPINVGDVEAIMRQGRREQGQRKMTRKKAGNQRVIEKKQCRKVHV